MSRWIPRFDWKHSQNWLPGVLGISAAILLIVVAANAPAPTDSKPSEPSSSQSASLAAKPQTSAPPPSQPAVPHATPAAVTAAKAQTSQPPAAPAAAAASEVAKPAPAHDHAMAQHTMAQAAAPAQNASAPDKAQQKDAAAGPSGLQGDPVAGRQVFKKCQACHSLEPGKTILGPSLAGIVGRKSGVEPNFNYSPAMKQAALTWDAATLDAYLMDPQKIVPGNRMPFPGLKTDQDRSDVIAFLAAPVAPATAPNAAKATPPPAAPAAAPQAGSSSNPAYVTDAKYTLRTGIAEGKMV